MQFARIGDLINTLLQQGVARAADLKNCFNSFRQGVETAKAVTPAGFGIDTPLKWGVYEMHFCAPPPRVKYPSLNRPLIKLSRARRLFIALVQVLFAATLTAAETNSAAERTAPVAATNLPFCAITNGARASWSPDGRQLVFCRSSARRVEIYDFNTRTNRLLAEEARDPAWSPDGKWIAYVRQPENVMVFTEEVMVVAPEGGRPRLVYPGNFMNWSGDSKTLFVNARREQKLVACRLEALDAEAKTLMENTKNFYAMVSPDGSRIAMPARGETQVLDAKTGERLYSIPMQGQPGGFAGWSPEGDWLIIGGVDQANLGAWLVDLKQKKTHPLAAGSFTMPAFSPKGDLLAMDLRAQTRREIWVFPRAWIEARLKDQAPIFTLPDQP
jgi:WD40 repeat protein